jgi:LysM repeat protein
MNNPSPLVPQGTQPKRGKSSLYIKVLMILAVHVVVIGGMLLQGCKDTGKTETKDPSLSQSGGDMTTPSNSLATGDTIPAVNTMMMSNQAVATLPANQPAITAVPTGSGVATTAIPSPAVPVAATVASTDGKDYVIARGDTLAAIAKRNSVSLKTLMDANPGVSPKKLRVGQKIQVPGSTGAMAAASTSTSTGAGAAAADAAPDGATYIVKSGDTLGRIARAHGTSYKKIMALNNLSTTAIRVGQKLKLPAPKTASAEPAPAATASIAPTPGPVSSISPAATGVAN